MSRIRAARRLAGVGAAILLASLVGAHRARGASAGLEHLALSLSAGESYVINDVAPDTSAAVNVRRNARALYIYTEPSGRVTLLGAEPGDWTVTLTLRDGRRVAYDVAVKSRVDIEHPLRPADSAPAIVGSGTHSGPAAPVAVTRLDAGAGPVDPSPTTGVRAPEASAAVTLSTSAPAGALADTPGAARSAPAIAAMSAPHPSQAASASPARSDN